MNIINHGDILEMNGAEIAPVDIITGGSPCQNISAVNHTNNMGQGLDGDKSSLFFEFIRVIKEMHEHSAKPRYVIFENVPQLLFSNNGCDFRDAITELIRVKDPDFVLCSIHNVTWGPAGFVRAFDRSWSFAWRVCDSLYWGVAQKRKRLAIFIDYYGDTARAILCRGTLGDENACFKITETMFGCKEWMTSLVANSNTGKAPSVPIQTTLEDVVELNAPAKYNITRDQAKRITDNALEHNLNLPPQLGLMFKCVILGCDKIMVPSDPSMGLPHPQHKAIVNKKHNVFCMWKTLLSREWHITDYTNTLRCEISSDGTKYPLLVIMDLIEKTEQFLTYKFTVRRFMPLEVERLFGYPDNWTLTSDLVTTIPDTYRYKMLGNSIALPQWEWLFKSIVKAAPDNPLTHGSLFDGIGGFPLCASRAGIWTKWVSEIDLHAAGVFDFNCRTSQIFSYCRATV